MSKKQEEISVEEQMQSIDKHFTRNELREVWGIIEANCKKLPKLLYGEVKREFEHAFKKMGHDIGKVLENIDTNTKKTWIKFKDSFDKFMTAVAPLQEAIGKTAKEIWSSIVQIYKIVAEYCDHKAREFSTAIVKVSQEGKTWVEATAADAGKAFKKAGQEADSWAKNTVTEGEKAFKSAEKGAKSWVKQIEKSFKGGSREK